jgi:hypothetical protein
MSYDNDDEDMDESQMRGTGICRACHQMKHDVLADNGYCGDCD